MSDVKDLEYYEENPGELPLDDEAAVERLVAEMDGDSPSMETPAQEDGDKAKADEPESAPADKPEEDKPEDNASDDTEDHAVPLNRHKSVTKGLQSELDAANQEREDLRVANARLEEQLKIQKAPEKDDPHSEKPVDDPFVAEYGLTKQEYQEEFGDEGLKVAEKTIQLENQLKEVKAQQEQFQEKEQESLNADVERAINAVPELKAVLENAFSENATRHDRLAWDNAQRAHQMLLDEDATYRGMSIQDRFSFLAKDLGLLSQKTEPDNLPTPKAVIPTSVSDIPSSSAVMQETEAQKILSMSASEMNELARSDPARYEQLLDMIQ